MSININSDTVIIALGFFICVIIVVALLKNRIKRMNIKTNTLSLEIEAIEDIPLSEASITNNAKRIDV